MLNTVTEAEVFSCAETLPCLPNILLTLEVMLSQAVVRFSDGWLLLRAISVCPWIPAIPEPWRISDTYLLLVHTSSYYSYITYILYINTNLIESCSAPERVRRCWTRVGSVRGPGWWVSNEATTPRVTPAPAPTLSRWNTLSMPRKLLCEGKMQALDYFICQKITNK